LVTLLEIRILPSVSGFVEYFLLGHSVKEYFVECCTRQNIALGKAWHSANLVFAECRSTWQTLHSAKGGWAITAATCRQILPSA
jgi:hypothetical protein